MADEGPDAELTGLETGGEEALADLFSRHEERLTRMVRFRMDHRLWGRVDPADVLQESYLEASRRLAGYLRDPAVPVFVWLRRMTEQTLLNIHRRHLGAKIRDASLEVSLHRRGGGQATSISLAARLAADWTSPSQAAMREEMLGELREAFDSMDPIDREVLALRHFEGLSNNEVAEILGLQKAAASNRYVRALKRLKTMMSRMPSYGESLVRGK
jgi:RNA polymerase sigma-70 factor (ECF subfamily)